MWPLSSDVIIIPLCFTLPHNLINQGLQFDFSSATFFTQTVLFIKDCEFKKKNKNAMPSSSALYIHMILLLIF